MRAYKADGSAYPWRQVTSIIRHDLTLSQRRDASRLYLILACGHEMTRPGSKPEPKRVRCRICKPMPAAEQHVMVTAESLTDEQIRAARDAAPEFVTSEVVADALGMPRGPNDNPPQALDIILARRWIAAAINARAKGG